MPLVLLGAVCGLLILHRGTSDTLLPSEERERVVVAYTRICAPLSLAVHVLPLYVPLWALYDDMLGAEYDLNVTVLDACMLLPRLSVTVT